MNTQGYDREKLHINVARIKKEGTYYEVVIDSDAAVAYRSGGDIDIKDVLKSEHVFSDAHKGLKVGENELKSIFGTPDPLEVAGIIIKKGEIQLTAEYREKLREEKRKKLVYMIHKNGVDPKTHLPHPPARIEAAMEEAKVHLDEFKSVEAQLQDVIKAIRPILPIRFEIKEIAIKVSGEYAGKLYGIVKQFGKMLKEEWLKDGSWAFVIEMPGGLEQDFYDKLNSITHGDVESKLVNTR